jgi:hypothetical protein
MASGVLPDDPPPIERPAPTLTPGSHASSSGALHELCTICVEAGPQVQYFYIAGQVVRVHAACDAL